MRQLGLETEPSPEVLDAEATSFGLPQDLPETAALAVSGGSDSVALLRLGHRVWGKAGKKFIVLTVDHGLREESAREAEQVAAWCAGLGVEHCTLRWKFDGTGNLSAAAREGRYRVMSAYCRERGIGHLYTGHTKDDQAETVLMRFARGSGVDGLAGMDAETSLWGIRLMRPFLRCQTRDSLRAILASFGQEWIEDPTNDDVHYDRVKARALFEHLEPLGITVDALSRLSDRMALAKQVLRREAEKLGETAVQNSPFGFVTLDVAALAEAETETACRVLGEAVQRMSGQGYRAPIDVEKQMLALALRRETAGGQTYSGCSMRPAGDSFHILREPSRCAVRTQTGAVIGRWDGRFAFEIEADDGAAGLQVGALGEAGLTQIPKDYQEMSEAWRSCHRDARLSAPGLWRGDVLLSAPLAPWIGDPSVPKLHISTDWSKKT